MQHCIFCGAELPENARFCGQCGRVQEDTTRTNAEPTISSASYTPAEYSGAPASNASGPQAGAWPYASGQRDRDDHTMPAPLPFPAGQPAAPTAPVIQGIPQPGSVPAAIGAPPPPPLTTTGTFPSTTVGAAKAGVGAAVKWIIIAVVVVVVVAGTGIGFAIYHFSTLPQPTISAASKYRVGSTLAGAVDTSFRINGQKFSTNSPITFLLDGKPLAIKQAIQSDAAGKFQAELRVTNLWALGSHILTARDGGNYTTQKGIPIIIVQQGAANTPGPDGAPPDDASFQIAINGQYTISGKSYTEQDTEIVTGHPYPASGTVCQPEDKGQPQVYVETTINSGESYRETSTFSCNGTYEGGALILKQTMLTDKIEFAPYGASATCSLGSSQVDEQLSGSYVGNDMFQGTLTYYQIPTTAYTCNRTGAYFFHYGAQGTWVGQIKQ